MPGTARHLAIFAFAACVMASAANASAATTAYGTTTGQSWQEPHLGEVLHGADLLAECRVLAGGLFHAVVEPVKIYRGDAALAGVALDVEGFNGYEWNTAYHAMRAGDRLVLALFSPRPELGELAPWTLAVPSAGRFAIERGRVVAKIGRGDFLVQVPEADFRQAIELCIDPARAAGGLGEMLRFDAIEARYLAAVLLGELPPGADVASAAQSLLTLSRDPNPAMRLTAANSLGRLGGAEAARALAEFLTDADREVARAAARAVAEAGSPGAGRELVAWIARANPDDRDDAEVMSKAFVFLAEGGWRRDADDVEHRAVTAGLVDMVQTGDTVRARLSARVLGRLGAADAVPQLLRLLGSDAADLRTEAASALLAITLAPETLDPLEAAEWWRFNRERPRSAWVEAGLARAADLARSARESDRRLAAAFLAESKHPLGVWAVRDALSEGWAEAPVGSLLGPLALAVAEDALLYPYDAVRAAAIDSLAAFAKDVGYEGCGWMARPLELALGDPSAEVAAKAVRLLGEVGGRGSARVLVERLRQADGERAEAVAQSLRRATGRRFGFYVGRGWRLPEEMRGIELWERWADSLPETPLIDETPAAPPRASGLEPADLRRLMGDDWLSAFDVIRDMPSDQIAALFVEGDAIIRCFAAAASAFAPHASPAHLETALGDPEPLVRVQAAWALGVVLGGTREPPERLVEAAREGEGLVRRAAMLALAKIGGDVADEVFGESVAEGDVPEAAGMLGLIESARSAELMVAVAGDSRFSAALVSRSLAARRPPGAASPVLSRIAEADLRDAYALIFGLERAARRECSGELAKALGSDDAIVAYAAARALAAMRPAPPAETADALVRALVHSDEEVAMLAATALAAIAERNELTERLGQRATASLRALLRSGEFVVASRAAQALERVGLAAPGMPEALLLYRQSWRPQDPRALPALMRLGNDRSRDMVEALARDGQWGDQYFATYALRHHPDRARAVRLLLGIWQDRESPFAEAAAQSLVSLGADAVGPVTEIAGNGGDAALSAVVLLGRLTETASGDAIRALESLAGRADAAVSRLAGREIGRAGRVDLRRD